MLVEHIPDFQITEAEIRKHALSGFGILVNLRNLSPEFFYSTYPEKWQDIYTRNAMVVHDPVVQWAVVNTGWKRWSEINFLGRPANEMAVMRRAKEFGLEYGMIASIRRQDRSGKMRRSLFGAARPDREFTEEEAGLLLGLFQKMLEQLVGPSQSEEDHMVSESDIEILRRLAEGQKQDEVASGMGLSVETVSKRVRKIKETWGTRTLAATIATAFQRGVLGIKGRW